MLQEIITYTIVALAIGIALFRFYRSLDFSSKNSGCGNCSCDKKC